MTQRGKTQANKGTALWELPPASQSYTGDRIILPVCVGDWDLGSEHTPIHTLKCWCTRRKVILGLDVEKDVRLFDMNRMNRVCLGTSRNKIRVSE